MPLPRMRGMRGGHGIKGTVGQPSVQQPTQGKLRTANLAKRGSAAGHRQGGPGFLARAADTDVSLRRTELPYPTQASDYLGLPAQAPWASESVNTSLPPALHRLLDAGCEVHLPAVSSMKGKRLDNRELDKLLASLGRSETTWRRALLVQGWLQDIGHRPDDRLCTTLIRLCSTHGDAQQALQFYDWMRLSRDLGGAGLLPTVFTYTAAMRAALSGSQCSRAFQIWEHAAEAGCHIDCRMCTVYIEVCTKAGQPERALAMYRQMACAEAGSRLTPSVHTYTAALRAAAADEAHSPLAVSIWEDMLQAGCQPTGHAFAAAISACGAAARWEQAADFFHQMLGMNIRPDVVSCTAFASALAAGGQWQRCEEVLQWMQKEGVQPNVRTYTALLVALGTAGEWERLADLLRRMQQEQWLRAEPNAYTYASLLKVMSEQGRLDLAEQLFAQLYPDVLAAVQLSHAQTHQASEAPLHQSPLASNTTWSISDSSASSSTAPWQLSATLQPASPPGSQLPAFSLPTSASQQSLTEQLDAFTLYEALPTAMAESVLASRHSFELAVLRLPDNLPGQAGFAEPVGFGSDASSPDFATSPLQLALPSPGRQSVPASQLSTPRGMVFSRPQQASGSALAQPMCSAIVTTAMMAAYERSHSWREAIHLLQHTRHSGASITSAQANITIMALGKLGDIEGAGQLFFSVAEPDSGTFCAVIVAYGLAGLPSHCEGYLAACHAAGFAAHQSCFCSLIAAYCLSGQWQDGLAVRERLGTKALNVHVFNALLIACQMGGQHAAAARMCQELQDDQLVPNEMTLELMHGCKRQPLTSQLLDSLRQVVVESTAACRGTV